MGSTKRKKNESYFKSTSPPIFLRIYSIYNILKISAIAIVLYYLAFEEQSAILNAYPNYAACSKCLNAAVAAQKTSYYFEFGYCDQTFFASGNPNAGVSSKGAMTAYNSVKNVNLLLNQGSDVWKRSLVLEYPTIVYSVAGFVALCVIMLLYCASVYGSSNLLEEQSPIFVLNLLVCSELSVITMWFTNTIYGIDKLNSCYVTTFSPTFSMISFIGTLSLIFLGILWFFTVRSKYAIVSAVCACVPFLAFMGFELYLASQIYSFNKNNYIPLVVCAFMCAAVFELPLLYHCCHFSYSRKKDEENKPAEAEDDL